MRMLSLLPRHELKRQVEEVLSSAQFFAETLGHSTQRAYYDEVLVDSVSLACRDTLHLIRQLPERMRTRRGSLSHDTLGVKWRHTTVTNRARLEPIRMLVDRCQAQDNRCSCL
jgi:hypothetical protein